MWLGAEPSLGSQIQVPGKDEWGWVEVNISSAHKDRTLQLARHISDSGAGSYP